MSKSTTSKANHCNFPSINSLLGFTNPQWQHRKHPLVTVQVATRQKTTDCSSRCSYKILKVHGAKAWWNRLRFTATGGSLWEGVDVVIWPLVHTAERTGRPSTKTSVESAVASIQNWQGRAQGCGESKHVPTWLLVQILISIIEGASKHASYIFRPQPNKISDFRQDLSIIFKSFSDKCTVCLTLKMSFREVSYLSRQAGHWGPHAPSLPSSFFSCHCVAEAGLELAHPH